MTVEVVLSFLLAFISMSGLWVVSKNPSKGWLVCVISEVLWVSWAIYFKQWGLGILCLCYGIVYLHNLIKSKENNV